MAQRAKKLKLERIEDDSMRKANMARGKMGLLKRAVELSVTCGVDIGIIMFDEAGKLTQYSASNMDELLERYSAAVVQPHERRSNEELLKVFSRAGSRIGYDADEPAPDGRASAAGRRRGGGEAESPSSLSDGSLAAAANAVAAADVLRPLGLLIDKELAPISPKSEVAYATINSEFDRIFTADYPTMLHAGAAAPTSSSGGKRGRPPRPNSGLPPSKRSTPDLRAPNGTPHAGADAGAGDVDVDEDVLGILSGMAGGGEEGDEAAAAAAPAADQQQPGAEDMEQVKEEQQEEQAGEAAGEQGAAQQHPEQPAAAGEEAAGDGGGGGGGGGGGDAAAAEGGGALDAGGSGMPTQRGASQGG